MSRYNTGTGNSHPYKVKGLDQEGGDALLAVVQPRINSWVELQRQQKNLSGRNFYSNFLVGDGFTAKYTFNNGIENVQVQLSPVAAKIVQRAIAQNPALNPDIYRPDIPPPGEAPPPPKEPTPPEIVLPKEDFDYKPPETKFFMVMFDDNRVAAWPMGALENWGGVPPTVIYTSRKSSWAMPTTEYVRGPATQMMVQMKNNKDIGCIAVVPLVITNSGVSVSTDKYYVVTVEDGFAKSKATRQQAYVSQPPSLNANGTSIVAGGSLFDPDLNLITDNFYGLPSSTAFNTNGDEVTLLESVGFAQNSFVGVANDRDSLDIGGWVTISSGSVDLTEDFGVTIYSTGLFRPGAPPSKSQHLYKLPLLAQKEGIDVLGVEDVNTSAVYDPFPVLKLRLGSDSRTYNTVGLPDDASGEFYVYGFPYLYKSGQYTTVDRIIKSYQMPDYSVPVPPGPTLISGEELGGGGVQCSNGSHVFQSYRIYGGDRFPQFRLQVDWRYYLDGADITDAIKSAIKGSHIQFAFMDVPMAGVMKFR